MSGADSQWDVQTALYTALQVDTALQAVLADRIFDYVPEETIFPYLVLGNMTAQAFDTQIGNGLRISFMIKSFSRYLGMQESKQIMRDVYNLLHEKNDWVIVGQTIVSCRFISSSTGTDKDGKTKISIQNFEIITEETI